MKSYEYEEYSVPGFVDNLMRNKQDFGVCRVKLHPNTKIDMPVRMFILNVIFWEPLMQFGIRPTIKEFNKFKYLTNTAISKVHTQMYEVFLDQRPDLPYMDFVNALFYNIGRLYNFVKMNCGEYLPSIDALGLTRLMQNEPLKKLADTHLDPKLGTKVAEVTMKRVSEELNTLLADPSMESNVLYPYVKAGVLKPNQTPQMLVAYGPRSDIDDTMRKHIISNSAFSGLDSVEDYATEYLSAKKAAYANTRSIEKSQYWARKLKLALSNLPNLYVGSCGSDRGLAYRIPAEFKHNFIECILLDGNKHILLTHNNIDKYVNTSVQLLNPFCCNYTDGVCERCAGYGRGRLHKYMPPRIHIGLLSAMRVASMVSQKILSTKHLISTMSTLMTLSSEAERFFSVVEDTIRFKPNVANMVKKLSIRIPMDAISMIEDLQLGILPLVESFSKISFIEFVNNDDVKHNIQLGTEDSLPYLSEHVLRYMKDYPEHLRIEADFIEINMKNFDMKLPFCKYIIMNDDMMAYHARVSSFLSTSVRNHTTVAGALNEFSATVYDKSSVDFFYLSMVLRSFNVCEETNYKVPVVTDMNNTRFDGMAQNIGNSTLTMKLSFERLGDYLSDPTTVIIPRPIGMYAPFYGLK